MMAAAEKEQTKAKQQKISHYLTSHGLRPYAPVEAAQMQRRPGRNGGLFSVKN